jgi:hypothetical protein
MQVISQIECQVLPTTKLVVKGEDGKTAEYTLVLDYCAIAKAEEILKRDLSVILNWRGLSGPDLSVICYSSFDRYHPEVTLRQVRQWLAPSQNDQLFSMLFEAAYPGVLAKMIEAAKELPAGESPNVEAAAIA